MKLWGLGVTALGLLAVANVVYRIIVNANATPRMIRVAVRAYRAPRPADLDGCGFCLCCAEAECQAGTCSQMCPCWETC